MELPEAIEKAKTYLQEVFPDLDRENLQLEEIETPPNGAKWLFTFSGSHKTNHEDSLNLKDILRARRAFKSVELDAATGQLLAIRNQAA